MPESASFESTTVTLMEAEMGQLKARVQRLEQENAHLTSQAEDMLLLGVIHEAINPLSDCQQILTKGLERMALLKDIPLCCGGMIEHGAFHVVSSGTLFSGDNLDGCCISLNTIIGSLEQPRYLKASACSQLDLPVPDTFCANEILLVPFHSRFLPDGLFLFACDSEEGNRLDASAALLERIVDAMALKMDNAMVMDVLKDINSKLDQRVEERSRALDESEAQLLQAQKMEGIGTLVGGIAHDFNNMLAGMMGNLYLIGHDESLSSEGRARADRINELCDRASKMIGQLLTFARKGMVRMEPVVFRPFLEESLKLVELGVPENIAITHAFDLDETATLMGDEVQLQQLVLNLLVNARDAVKAVDKPSIHIGLQRIGTQTRLHEKYQGLADGPWLELSVADNGCGIPESIRDQLFEPFFTTKEVGEGTGLGLSTVYGVVQSHQGAIQIDSKQYQGTTFRIYLPLHGEQSVEVRNSAERLPQGHGETVLLVDDEEIVLNTTSALLTHLGYQVITANTGLDALGKEGLETIDIALLDVVMPEMGGVETAGRLRAINPKLPIILATAYDRKKVLTKQDKIPNSWILSKPFRMQVLATTLKKSLQSR